MIYIRRGPFLYGTVGYGSCIKSPKQSDMARTIKALQPKYPVPDAQLVPTADQIDRSYVIVTDTAANFQAHPTVANAERFVVKMQAVSSDVSNINSRAADACEAGKQLADVVDSVVLSEALYNDVVKGTDSMVTIDLETAGQAATFVYKVALHIGK